MRFATRLLLVQLATVTAVVAICVAVFGWLAVRQLRAESEASALNIARTVAEDPDVRARVADFSADPGTPDDEDLRDGALQQVAIAVAERTDALFVVITDDHGIRLAHPNQDLLGQVVSTPFAEVLEGNEVVDWETGTLGESARAKVPILPPDGEHPVGEVSVGFERASVFDDLPALVATIAVAATGALVLATLATLLLRRRFERETLGLQPEELVALVQNQAAVLDGVGDGVIAIDTASVVRVCNRAAERMLGLEAPVGRTVEALGLAGPVLEAMRDGVGTGKDAAGGGVEAVVADRVLYIEVRPVLRDERSLGRVVVVRDRTDIEALAGRLETVRAMTEALRVQRHEFANRLHVATGLLDAGRTDDARAFLGDLTSRGSVDFAVEGIERLPDPFLQSLVGALSMSARERGVALRVSDDTLLLGEVAEPEDVAAILGNLVDNAVRAAVSAAESSPGWVELALLGDRGELVVTVADSGPGLPAGADPFSGGDGPASPSASADAVHGHGYGLPLSRDLARRHGGDVWVIDAGGEAAGAVFGARIPHALREPDGDGSDREEPR
jgi:two-component system CitB family sensor kinase